MMQVNRMGESSSSGDSLLYLENRSIRELNYWSATVSKLLTVTEAAERLSVSISCIYQLVEKGKLSHHRIGIGRGAIRFSEDDIEGFLVSCRFERLKLIDDMVSNPQEGCSCSNPAYSE